jgi:putative transposase
MGLNIPVNLTKRDNSGYQASALQMIADGAVSYIRIIKRTVKGKEKLYAQVVLKGSPFVKAHHKVAFGKAKGKRVGLDLGVSSLAFYSETRAGLLTGISEIKELQRKLGKHQAIASRLLRLANPENYKKTFKVKGRKTVSVFQRKKNVRDSVRTEHWKRENAIVVELHRKMAAKRKYMHDTYANEILSHGNMVITEKVSTKAWQKMFGKSIGAFAPANLMTVLNRKAENADGKVENIDTWKAKLSQYDHILDDYIKKKLGDRAMLVGGEFPVQRDLYSAFLAYCIDLEKQIVCRSTAERQWTGARLRLDAAVKHLQIAKGKGFVPSSAGVAQLERLSRRAIAA